MGDNATEIDLDSVIDRLLEGTSLPLLVIEDGSEGPLGSSIEHILHTLGGILPVPVCARHRVDITRLVTQLRFLSTLQACRQVVCCLPGESYALVLSPLRDSWPVACRHLVDRLCQRHR